MVNYRREGGDLRCDRSKIQSTYTHKLGGEGQPAAVCRLRAVEDVLDGGRRGLKFETGSRSLPIQRLYRQFEPFQTCSLTRIPWLLASRL